MVKQQFPGSESTGNSQECPIDPIPIRNMKQNRVQDTAAIPKLPCGLRSDTDPRSTGTSPFLLSERSSPGRRFDNKLRWCRLRLIGRNGETNRQVGLVMDLDR